MKRNVTLEEISDGRLYGNNDMVKADCHGCKGCYACCIGMGQSIILDPYDVYRLQKCLGKRTETLIMEEFLELNIVNGIVLPNLKMTGREERCVFLSKEGRCSIHENRPGLCRLFPLGRFYENGDFQYFLQTGECIARNRTKIKVSKWIDTPNQGKYHDFILRWHNVLKGLEEEAEQAMLEDIAIEGAEKREKLLTADMKQVKQKTVALLEAFFMNPYDTEKDFYEQFEERFQAFAEESL